MNYNEAIDYIHSTLWLGSKLGLSRMKELSSLMGNPEKDLKFIHIAGTNGKGSTASMLYSILTKAGYRIGLFTSPYINSFNERIAFNGTSISDEELAEITTGVRPFADSMEDSPTEFELVTAIGFEFFKRKQCDIVILEVGMGGELDSTNIIETPELAIITSIGFDHVKELGDTITKIAGAKAGIIKEDGHVVIYGKNKEAEAVFEAACKARNSSFNYPDYDRLTVTESDLSGHIFNYKNIKDLKLSLAGDYQIFNAAVVLKAIEVLREKGWSVSDEAVRAGLESAKWPGRFEILRKDPVFILDGGHNPQGVKLATDTLRHYFGEKEIVFLVGVMADKDVKSVISELIPMTREFIAVQPDNPRAMKADELSRLLCEMGKPATPYDLVEAGVDAAIERAGKDGIVCAIGSLYMSGVIRTHVLNMSDSGQTVK